MTKYLPILVTVAAAIGAALFTPSFFAAHPLVVSVLASAAALLHAALPSLFGEPGK